MNCLFGACGDLINLCDDVCEAYVFGWNDFDSSRFPHACRAMARVKLMNRFEWSTLNIQKDFAHVVAFWDNLLRGNGPVLWVESLFFFQRATPCNRGSFEGKMKVLSVSEAGDGEYFHPPLDKIYPSSYGPLASFNPPVNSRKISIKFENIQNFC